MQKCTVGSSTEEISRMALLCCASGSLAASDIRPPVSIMTNSRSPQEARMYSLYTPTVCSTDQRQHFTIHHDI